MSDPVENPPVATDAAPAKENAETVLPDDELECVAGAGYPAGETPADYGIADKMRNGWRN
ncbi:MAG: hypothetical protein M3Y49_11735 [Actinomycetota bacterium]|nr:hypothetical protein [Actinomycetota bacterium]